MLTLADMGGGGLFEMLTSANILLDYGNLHQILLIHIQFFGKFYSTYFNIEFFEISIKSMNSIIFELFIQFISVSKYTFF